MVEAIGVVIADDDARVRRGLVAAIEARPDMRVVASVGDGGAAIERCRGGGVGVAVLDLRMPGGGADAIAELRRVCPDVRIVVWTASMDDGLWRRALEAGAETVVLKGDPVAGLLDRIRGDTVAQS